MRYGPRHRIPQSGRERTNHGQGAIDRCPETNHLITCGDAHILRNPLQKFVRIPENMLRIVEAC